MDIFHFLMQGFIREYILGLDILPDGMQPVNVPSLTFHKTE